MRLIDLPITLREAAVKNQIAQGNERDVYRNLGTAFYWPKSKEGWHIWNYCKFGHFSETLKYRL